eukprot:12981861-Alexandrium_andersonii.AAC.1
MDPPVELHNFTDRRARGLGISLEEGQGAALLASLDDPEIDADAVSDVVLRLPPAVLHHLGALEWNEFFLPCLPHHAQGSTALSLNWRGLTGMNLPSMPALVREACLHAQAGAGEAGQLTQASAQRIADALRGHAERLREDGAALDVYDS